MDEEARAQETRNLLNCIVEYRTAAESLPASERDAVCPHLKINKMQKITIMVHDFIDISLQVINECDKAELWIRDKSQQQDSLPKNADPILWSSEIKKKADILDAYVYHLTILPNKHVSYNRKIIIMSEFQCTILFGECCKILKLIRNIILYFY